MQAFLEAFQRAIGVTIPGVPERRAMSLSESWAKSTKYQSDPREHIIFTDCHHGITGRELGCIGASTVLTFMAFHKKIIGPWPIWKSCISLIPGIFAGYWTGYYYSLLHCTEAWVSMRKVSPTNSPFANELVRRMRESTQSEYFERRYRLSQIDQRRNSSSSASQRTL